MATIPQGSKSFQERNPHLFKGGAFYKAVETPTGKGEEIVTNFVLQKSTDVQKLNKLEKAFYSHLQMLNYFWIGVQCITLKLADDCRLTPDFAAIGFNGELILWDVKGFQREDALLKMKFAARSFRWAKFIIVTREKGQWIEKEVKL